MNASAVSDAYRNAEINGIKNCKFVCAKVSFQLPQLSPLSFPIHLVMTSGGLKYSNAWEILLRKNSSNKWCLLVRDFDIVLSLTCLLPA